MAENTKQKSPEEKEKKEKSTLLQWIILIILIILLLLSLTRCQGCSNKSGPDPIPGDTRIAEAPEYNPDIPEIDPNAGEYVEPQAKTADTGSISIPGWKTLNIPKNEREVTVDFYNPEENKGQYQMTFELRLPDESEQGYEVLYKSGLVDPGLHIQHITLSHELKEGTYEATLHVQPYRMDEQKTATNNADMVTELVVS